MNEHFLKVERTARYYILGAVSSKTETVWIVCHGYAMLAGEFIKDFEPLADDKTLIVAPEALSRFYTKGFFGNVGATWMTREDRLHEIEDYVNYLQQLYESIKSKVSAKAKFNLLGFSQGVATVSRWATYKKPKLENLWLCSGEIPKDLDWNVLKNISQTGKLKIVFGTKDPFIQHGDIQTMEKALTEKEIKFEMRIFDGEHVIHLPSLKE